MPIGTITMILTNVGLSIFNNWAGSRQNKQITQKREEFERVARDGQRERMMQLMREGQKLTLELEEQKHKERLSELNDQFDNLIKELAYSATIDHWPLKTLPIVMKNQALGNLLANQEEKVAMHCILTSSNCKEFNEYVLPKVESALEAYCNIHWSNLSGSPVLFYSGAWKSDDVPSGTDVASMNTALSNLPTLLITPFFRPQDHKLVFQAYVWGVGCNNSDQFTIPVIDPNVKPENADPNQIRFSRDYTSDLKWLAEEGLIEECFENLVPYLECLIGYIADSYFWSAFGSVPQLPRLLTDGTINTDGMKYLVDDIEGKYNELYSSATDKCTIYDNQSLLSLSVGLMCFNSKPNNKEALQKLFLDRCSLRSQKNFSKIEDAVNNTIWTLDDFAFLQNVVEISQDLDDTNSYQSVTCLLISLKEINYNYDALDSKDIFYLEKESERGNVVATYRLGELYEYSMGTCGDDIKSKQYYQQSSDGGFFLAKVKRGQMSLTDISARSLEILENSKILQIEVLYTDQLIQNQNITKEEFDSLYKKISNKYLMSGKIYSHPGLITNLARLMLLVGYNKNTPRYMLEMAGKMGYKKANQLLTKI